MNPLRTLVFLCACAFCHGDLASMCQSDDFAVRFPGPATFSVSKLNGSCACPGGFRGSGAYLTELWRQPDVVALNASIRTALGGLEASISATTSSLSQLQQSVVAVDSAIRSAINNTVAGVLNANCFQTSDCLPGLVCSPLTSRCLYAAGRRCTNSRQCVDGCSPGGFCVSCTGQAFRTCAEALALGCTISATVTLDPDGPGGNAPFSAYCEQIQVAGGGWTAVWSTLSGQANDAPWSTFELNPTSNPYTTKYHLSLAQIQSINHTEHVLYRSSVQWLRIGGKFFAPSQWPGHVHESVVIRAYDGSQANAYLDYSSTCNSGGGWYAVSNGLPDHHTCTYNELNSGCGNDYVYQYADNQFASNMVLGSGWGFTSPSCCNTVSCTQSVVVMVR